MDDLPFDEHPHGLGEKEVGMIGRGSKRIPCGIGCRILSRGTISQVERDQEKFQLMWTRKLRSAKGSG